MINNTIYSGSIYYFNSSFDNFTVNTCELNQLSMLNQLQSLPRSAFLLGVLSLLFLIGYVKFEQYRLHLANVQSSEDTTKKIALLTSKAFLLGSLLFQSVSSLLLYLLIFKPSKDQLDILENGLMIVLIILAVWMGYRWNRKKKEY